MLTVNLGVGYSLPSLITQGNWGSEQNLLAFIQHKKILKNRSLPFPELH